MSENIIYTKEQTKINVELIHKEIIDVDKFKVGMKVRCKSKYIKNEHGDIADWVECYIQKVEEDYIVAINKDKKMRLGGLHTYYRAYITPYHLKNNIAEIEIDPVY